MRIIEEEDGKRYATQCECTFPLRALRAIERANLPRQYETCTFETFVTDHVSGQSSVARARNVLKRFVAEWGSEEIRKGLLITGTIGAGKTHLAVATLRALMSEYGARGLFYDHRALLRAIQNTYNSRSSESELDVLGPVFRADVLVLDELGYDKRTEWAGEMMEHILNTRYNDRLTTIITTNFPNRPAQGLKSLHSAVEQAKHAVREETLGDRIGERIFSRLQEMCYVVEVKGDDFRQTVNRASHAGPGNSNF